MENQINLNEITDEKELKALAYDQMVALEQAQRNLQAINERLAQLSQASASSKEQ